jgi:hypothetical protein
MLYLRTASGDFINAAKIVALSPHRDDGSEEIAGWIAICADGEAVALAAYYTEPGRLEHAIRFMPTIETGLASHSAS